MTALDSSTPEADVAALIDAVRRTPERREELLSLLPERAPVYAGRSSAEVTRLRGYLLAAFAEAGLPAEALPYALEVLESGHQPYEIAGAARAVRGADHAAYAAVAPYLVRAVRNLGGADATVSFERYDPRWPYDQPTTAMTELLRTLAAMGSDAAAALPALERLAEQRLPAAVPDELRAACDAIRGSSVDGCCHEDEDEVTEPEAIEAPVVGTRLCDLDVELEDQTGRRESLARFFHGKPAVVAFFYTRCDSPYKCSLTITRLAALQTLLEARGLAGAMRLVAMTYDPDFDLPGRLERYGRDRGVRFGDDVRFFRPASGFDALARRLALGVGYGPSTVNRHRIELFLLDAAGDVAASFTRLQWDPDAVLAAAEGLLAPAS